LVAVQNFKRPARASLGEVLEAKVLGVFAVRHGSVRLEARVGFRASQAVKDVLHQLN